MPSAMDIYNQALQQQQTMATQVRQGFEQLRQQIAPQQARIAAGYQQLGQQVLGRIGDIGRSQAQALADQYAQLSGRQAQQLTSRGLANTTVSQAIQRGLALDKAKADIALQERIAGLQAGYMKDIGMAGLGYQAGALGQQAALGAQGLSAWSRFAPSLAGLYGQLGASQQRITERALMAPRYHRRAGASYGFGGDVTSRVF